jgi:photosystem II stability/assembly factor-like uncharacterized protein
VDGGTRWIKRAPPAWSLDPGLVAAGVTVWSGGLQTMDGGRRWTVAAQPPGSPGGLWRASPTEVFATGLGAPLSVSENGGATWNPSPLPLADLGVEALAFSNASDGLAVTQTGHCPGVQCAAVDATRDGGTSWNTQATMALVGQAAALGAGFEAVLGQDASGQALALSTDGGQRWSLATLPAGVQCGGIDASGNALWLACLRSPHTGVVLESTDAGGTWTEATMAAVPQALAMTSARQGFMVAGGPGVTADGLYQTTDGGATWTEVWPVPAPR